MKLDTETILYLNVTNKLQECHTTVTIDHTPNDYTISMNRAIYEKLRKFPYLACTREEFQKHIESLWLPGMTWENYGLWHIDHIIPKSMFLCKDHATYLKGCHHTNLRPLWRHDNCSRGDEHSRYKRSKFYTKNNEK